MQQEDLDALASQAGHSIDMTRLRYAPEIGMIASMSSDLLARFGRISQAWWQVIGFRHGYAPMLPLRARQDLRDAAPLPPLQSAPTPTQAPVINTQAMILAMTSVVAAEMQKIKLSLNNMVRKAVAEAMIQTQYPHIGRPIPAPTPSHALPVIEDEPMPDVRNLSPVSRPLDVEQTDIYGFNREHPDVDIDQIELAPSLVPTVLGSKGVSKEMMDALLHLHFPLLPSPTFKSPSQAQAVQLAVEGAESFVAVLPTGGGKSLTYTLPAFNPKESGHHSYVLIPSRALLQDQIDRAEALGDRKSVV